MEPLADRIIEKIRQATELYHSLILLAEFSKSHRIVIRAYFNTIQLNFCVLKRLGKHEADCTPTDDISLEMLAYKFQVTKEGAAQ